MGRPRKGGTLFGHSSDCYNWDNRCHCGSDQPLQLPPEEDTYGGFNYGYNRGSLHSGKGGKSGELFDRREPSLSTPRMLVYENPSHLNTSHDSYNLVSEQQPLQGYVNLPRELSHRGNQSTVVARGQYQGAESQTPQRLGMPPLLGHAPQCFLVDNRCHCISSEPYRLPPESPSQNQATQEHPYCRLSSGMAANNSNPNTSSLNHEAATDRQSIEDFGALSIQHNQQTPTHSIRSQFNSSHGASNDLPPSYSELFPDR